jgi:hypothetical protein
MASYEFASLFFASNLSASGGKASRFVAIDLRSSMFHASRNARSSLLNVSVAQAGVGPIIFSKCLIVSASKFRTIELIFATMARWVFRELLLIRVPDKP